MPEGRGIALTGAAVAALAALLIALGSSTPRWWSGGGEGSLEMGVGLRETELCTPQACRERGLDSLGSASESWLRLGAVGSSVGWVAAALLAATAIAVLVSARNRIAALLWAAAVLACLFALVVGTGFALSYPGFGGLGVGWAMWAYLGGAVLGAGSVRLLIAGAGSRRAP